METLIRFLELRENQILMDLAIYKDLGPSDEQPVDKLVQRLDEVINIKKYAKKLYAETTIN